MKIKLILTLFVLFQMNAWAGVIGSVKEVSGNVFVFNSKGETHALQKGEQILDLTEVLTEDSAQITIVNHLDQTIHLSSGTHVKFLNRILEVQNGMVWVVSKQNDSQVSVQTSNAKTNYQAAEFILSYDNSDGKSQLFVINGEVEFSNMLENDLKYDVSTGKFSYIHKDYENFTPREPTLIGFDSYKSLVSHFKEVKPQDMGFEKSLAINQKPSTRSIASVGEFEKVQDTETQTQNSIPKKENYNAYKKGKILFVKTVEGSLRAPASVPSSSDYYNKINQQNKAKRELNKMVNKVEVKIHKPQSFTPSPSVGERLPAAYGSGLMHDLNQLDAAKPQVERQEKAYPSEVNNLMKDLQNYRKDFKSGY